MKQKIATRVKVLLGLVIVAILALIITTASRNRTKAYEFTGNIKEVKEDSIIVEGQYLLVNSDNKYSKEFVVAEITITPETRIIRSAFKIPSEDELQTTGGMFFPDQLPKIESTVSLSEIKNDLSVNSLSLNLKSNKNIFGKEKFSGYEIVYRTPNQQ